MIFSYLLLCSFWIYKFGTWPKSSTNEAPHSHEWTPEAFSWTLKLDIIITMPDFCLFFLFWPIGSAMLQHTGFKIHGSVFPRSEHKWQGVTDTQRSLVRQRDGYGQLSQQTCGIRTFRMDGLSDLNEAGSAPAFWTTVQCVSMRFYPCSVFSSSPPSLYPLELLGGFCLISLFFYQMDVVVCGAKSTR